MPIRQAPLQVGLAVLARRARLGYGKTRLAATVGAQRALDIYRYLVGRTAAAALASRLPTTVLFDPSPGDLDLWPAASFARATQPAQATLDERITAGLRAAGVDRADSAALVIGTDCPALTGEVLAQAASALREFDAVLGPSDDGGFYLLGLKYLPSNLLDDIAWSTEAVADQMRDAFRQNGWRWHELSRLRDIDTEADWDAYRATLPSPPPKLAEQ